MRAWIAGIALVAFSAGAASADQTTCWPNAIGPGVHCQTTTATPIQPQVQLPAAPAPGTYCGVVCLGLMWKHSHDAKKAAKQQEQFRDMIGSMVREGQCEPAETAALRAGDYGLAEYVHRACKPAN